MPNFRLIVFLAVFVLGFSLTAQAEGEAGNFKLNDLNDRTYTLSDYRGKQPVLLFFWTTWCPYCQKELKNLTAKSAELSSSGVEVLPIDVGESKEKLERFVKSRNLNIRILLDKDSMVSGAYGILGVPTFYLVDKKGEIVFEESSFPENYRDLISKN